MNGEPGNWAIKGVPTQRLLMLFRPWCLNISRHCYIVLRGRLALPSTRTRPASGRSNSGTEQLFSASSEARVPEMAQLTGAGSAARFTVLAGTSAPCPCS